MTKRGCVDYDDTCEGETRLREDICKILCDAHYKSRIMSAEWRRRRLNE